MGSNFQSTVLQRHDLEAERAHHEAQEREHTLQSDLVAERGKSSDLGRANADLNRQLVDATAETQRLQAELTGMQKCRKSPVNPAKDPPVRDSRDRLTNVCIFLHTSLSQRRWSSPRNDGAPCKHLARRSLSWRQQGWYACQKSPMKEGHYIQNRPTDTQKRPHDTQNIPTDTQQRPHDTQKRPHDTPTDTCIPQGP